MTAPVIGSLSRIDGIRGVLCFGSYAMGTFDEQSDVDLYVLCHPAVVTPEARRRALQSIDGVTELQIGCQHPLWDNQWCPATDTFRLDGVLIDVGWNTTDWAKAVVRKVTEEGLISIPELRFRAYVLLGLLENSVILWDPEGLLREMRSNLYPYPPRLKQALLKEALPVLKESLGDMRDYVARGIGNTAFHFHLQRFLQALGTILFALNERYDPATKRVEQAYATMERVPQGFVARYTRALRVPLTDDGRGEAVRELEALARELETMIEAEAAAMDPPTR
jgi:hypothetical protein